MVEEPAQSDDSSSYSMTLSEFEEDRWYNPTSFSDDAAEIESIQRLIKYIRVTTQYLIISFNYYLIIIVIQLTEGRKSNGYGNCIGCVGGLQST